ncbi:phage baseplate assembly protein V [Geodermatophilus sp. SYSU D01062]
MTTVVPGDAVMTGISGCYPGAHPALVTDVVDPDGQGRVRIRLPWSPDPGAAGYEAWARLATLMAGAGRGSWFVPDVDDEVLVVFEAGDPRRPYVVGALWNGVDAPPQSMDGAGANDLKVLRSRNGITVTLDDHDGRERLVLATPGGQRVVLADGPGAIVVEDGSGNRAELVSGGIRLRSSGAVTVEASSVTLTAGTVTVDAGMSKFSGVVKADTVITNAVVSSSYTPGAGNIW